MSPPPSASSPWIGGRRRGEQQRNQRVIDEFLHISRERWRTSQTAWNASRERMRKEQKFAAGNGHQWEAADKAARTDDGRPSLEINRIPQFIRQVSNQSRANRSQIQIAPKAGKGSVELAGILQGVIKGIESDSDADVAYDTAVDHQLRIGLGFVRLYATFAANAGFEQVCRIGRFRNPLAVYPDPTTQEADMADMRYCHIVNAMGKDEYEARWGTLAPYQSLTEFVELNPDDADWMPIGKAIVVEYFYVQVEPATLLELDTGQTIWEDEYDDFAEAWQKAYPMGAVPQPARDRVVDVRKVYWCLHNAVEILEGNADRTAGKEVPGTRIPIYPVMGDEIDLDGKVDYYGMVHDAMDPARLYNFWASDIAETIALTPKAPWIAARGQIEQYLGDWSEANRVAHSVLSYDPMTVDGVIVPPPQRNVAEPPIQAMVLGLKEADQDLKAVMGLFEPSLGERGPQQSGKAIERVQQQGLIANSNYLDNLQRTKRSLGRSLLEWVRIIYDTPRLLHIVKPDGKKAQIVAHTGQENAPTPEEQQQWPDASGVFDLANGEYDVTVTTGASSPTERQQTEQWLLELFKAYPPLAQVGADVLLENSDQPVAQQLAKRAKRLLPPGMLEADDPEAQSLQLQAENQQLKDLVQKAHAAITTMAEVIKTQKITADARVKVAMIQLEGTLATALAKGNLAMVEQEYSRVEAMMDRIHQMTLSDAEHDQALEQQAEGAGQDQQAQAQAGQQQQQQQIQGQAHEAGAAAAAAQHERALADQQAQHQQETQRQAAAHALAQQREGAAVATQQQRETQQHQVRLERTKATLKPKPKAKKKP